MTKMDIGDDLRDYRRRVYADDMHMRDTLRALAAPEQVSQFTANDALNRFLAIGAIEHCTYRDAHGRKHNGLRVIDPEPLLAWAGQIILAGDPAAKEASERLGG